MAECLHATISREILVLSELELGDAPYKFDGSNGGSNAIDWGGDNWSRTMASSPWVHGEHMVGAKKNNSFLSMRLWLQGESVAEVQTAFDVLKAAVQQFTYTVVIQTDATTEYTYRGWVGDISLSFARNHLWNNAAQCDIRIPVMPLGV